MMLTAIYKFNGQTKMMVEDYPTKQAFIKDLRGNGFTVVRVSNNADLRVQEEGFQNVGQVKKRIKFLKELNAESANKLWTHDIENLEKLVKEAMALI